MRPILDTIEFFHALRSQARFGKFSRLPLRVHRFSVTGDSAECEWFLRPSDPWDSDLSPRMRQEHLTEQALLDALKLRELIFRGFPQVQRARLRLYREPDGAAPEPLELLMIGEVERETHGLDRVASLVMRARLYGFRFSLACGVLERISPAEVAATLHASS